MNHPPRWLTALSAIAIAACVAPPLTAGQSSRRATTTLSGAVVTESGKPVVGARVFLQTSDGRGPRTTKSGAAGRYAFTNLRQGLYEVRAQHGGLWSEWHHNVMVRAGQETRLTLRLVRSTPPEEKPALVRKLSGKVREWNVPLENARPHDPEADPKGFVWLTLQLKNQLARINPETGEWKLFPLPTPDSGPHGLVSDAQGNIWFTENSAGKIGRLDPNTGVITEFKAPTARDPHTPVFGPDGALWFTAQQSNLVARLDLKTGRIQEYVVPTQDARPYGMVVGPDSALWFCEFGTNKLGRVDPRTGAITEFAAPSAGSRPRRLAVTGGMIYYTDNHTGLFGRFDPATKAFKEWPSPGGPASQPYGIAADTEGNLWYNEFAANTLIKFTPKTESFEKFDLPSPRSEVRHMVRGPDGRIWMALSGANKLAVIE